MHDCLLHVPHPPRQLHSAFCRVQDEYRDVPGSVIASDFYHANALLPLSDETIIGRVQSHLEKCEPAFIGEHRQGCAFIMFHVRAAWAIGM